MLASDPISSRWTFADFLSSYRFWALFVAYFLVVFSSHSVNMGIHRLVLDNGGHPSSLGIFYGSSQFAWILGAVIAFAAAARRARTALIVPIVICAIVTLVGQSDSSLFASPGFLIVFGISKGTLVSVFTLACAILLVGGRPGKLDFACTFVLVSAPVALSSAFSSLAVAMFINEETGSQPLIWWFLGCIVLAALILLPCKPLTFEDAPRVRHAPLPVRQRSPLKVGVVTALLTIAVLVAILLMLPNISYSGRLRPLSDGTITGLAVQGIVALGSLIYYAYWTYRIHGELAGAEASQRLLTPLAALLVALFVPLGLPVLIMTLGDLLNDRARAKGAGGALSIAWLMIFCLLLPPVAMAMIQHAANKTLPAHR